MYRCIHVYMSIHIYIYTYVDIGYGSMIYNIHSSRITSTKHPGVPKNHMEHSDIDGMVPKWQKHMVNMKLTWNRSSGTMFELCHYVHLQT